MKQLSFRACLFLLPFLAILCFPLLNHKFAFIYDMASFENRALAKPPVLDVNLLDPFPAKYEKYYNEHFTLRSRIIHSFSLYNIDVLKKSPVPEKVIIGNNGWLYQAGDEQDSYTGRHAFTTAQLEAFRLELEYRQRYLAERGIKFYFYIAPSKPNIHGENMRYEEYKIDAKGWGEQLIAYLQKHSTVKPIDLYDVLREGKKHQDMYYALDNHWNTAGGLYASVAVLNRIHKDFPDVQALPAGDFIIKKIPTGIGNIQQMLGTHVYDGHDYEIAPKGGYKAKTVSNKGYEVTHGFPYPWDFELTKEVPGSTQPKLLLISDSFGAFIFPYLSESFSHSVKIFDAWQYKLNEDIVNVEKPDIVLLGIHEPILPNFLKYQSRLSAK